MRNSWSFLWERVLVCLMVVSSAAAAEASTLGRVGLDYLVAENETIVVGEAVAARSYWNPARTFILTDVQVSVSQTLKGQAGDEITVTLPGGKVDELTSVVVGGAELVPGRTYVLFLDRVNLAGAMSVLMVHDHGQGAFDVEMAGSELRAFSQGRRHELLADADGQAEPVGGAEGLPLADLVETVRDLATRARDRRPEVK
jgi:hypothetical protein